VNAGLRACVEALQGLDVPNGKLASVAIDAVDHIDGRRLFALQRGAIQEAFRVAADALYVAATVHELKTPDSSHAAVRESRSDGPLSK
jgi:hypothetical protein